MTAPIDHSPQAATEATDGGHVIQQHQLYAHGGKFWQVPENFEFPKDAKLLTGWQLWVGGQAGYEQVSGVGIKRLAPVRPFPTSK